MLPAKIDVFIFGMRKCLCCIILTTIARTASGLTQTANLEPQVVPAVQNWSAASGVLFTPAKLVIRINDHDAHALNGAAAVMKEDANALGFSDVEIRTGGPSAPGEITLAIDPSIGSKTHFANQAYQLVVADRVLISSPTSDGIFYGTRTLLQMLAVGKGHLTTGTIIDSPSYARRMLMIDVARKPFPVWVLKDYIRIMSWYKMNELHLHFSDDSAAYSAFRIQSKKFPGLASKDLSYSWEDLRDLQDFAKVRAVTITPEIDMPGHANSITSYWPELRHPRGLLGKDKLDVTNPKTVQIMESLLDEMIPLFDAPDFHIGTDEFGIGGTKVEKQEIGEDFRQFINTMNTFVRSKGKNCRIWSGFESMPGTTLPDPSVVIDMWVTHDAKSLIDAGHSVINSSDGSTYIVPGAHYYGVSNAGIYQSWEPYKISGDAAKNPDKADPHLLGGKLHIWNDQGPSGYTLTEIADLALPSIQVFSEKLWGIKLSANYRDFQSRAALAIAVPGVTIFQRNPATGPDGLVYQLDGEQALADASDSVNLPGATNPLADMEYSNHVTTSSRADLEYPWTFTMKIKRTADTSGRGVIMSSDLVEICANDTKETQTTEKGPDGKDIKKKTTKSGVGIFRAAGAFGVDPHASSYWNDTNGIIAEPLPLNEWIDMTIVGKEHKTECYINGKLSGSNNNQMVCPLKHLGSTTGNSFIGAVKDLKVWNSALSAKEVARIAGLTVLDNLAANCKVTAFRSDSDHGFTPELMVDDDAGTRWSSGPTHDSGWIAFDLAKPGMVSGVQINFENAFARKLIVETSDDGAIWHSVATSEGHVGIVEISFPPVHAQHVRVQLSDPGTEWGYSIWELEVLGVSENRNPILPDGSADPSARVFGNRVYVYPSHDLSPDNNDWIMNDWHVYSSADLAHWQDHGVILRGSDVKWAKFPQHCWAPDCINRNGKFYFYFPIGDSGCVKDEIGVAVSDSATGPFKDPLGKPLVAIGDTPGRNIDPNVFINDDGQAYLIWGNGRCFIAKLKPSMIELDGPIRQIQGLQGYAEGPWMHKRDGIYYLSYCVGGTSAEGHIDYAMSSQSPMDGFKYRGTVIAPTDSIKGTAHHSIVEFKGQWYVFYHSLQPTPFYRKCNIDYLKYNDDGTIQRVTPTLTGVDPVE